MSKTDPLFIKIQDLISIATGFNEEKDPITANEHEEQTIK